MKTLIEDILEACRAGVVHLEACEQNRIIHPFKSASLPLLKKLLERMEQENRWIDAMIPFGPVYATLPDGTSIDSDSMMKRGLIQAGVLIELENGHVQLIGHLNELGGTCDDCNIGRNTIVRRYKVVFEMPKPPVEPYRDPKRI